MGLLGTGGFKPRAMEAVISTPETISETDTDRNGIADARGLLASLNSFEFISNIYRHA